MRLYAALAGKEYISANEVTPFDVDSAAVNPFPYLNKSCELVGNHLMAIGFLIKNLNLPVGAKILEFGPGWGNTTLILAKMGFDVTAVDIEQNFIDLIDKRAQMECLKIKTIRDDFSYINTVSEPVDAVLFFECFHHSADHLAIIRSFDKAVKRGGVVCFASEPITSDFPIPWGLRMDGQSIWAIRRNGWLELGFNERYFHSALAKFGWRGSFVSGHDSPESKLIIAKRNQDWRSSFNFTNTTAKLLTQVGLISDEGCQSNGQGGYLCYGPYIDLPAGMYAATLNLDTSFGLEGSLVIEVIHKLSTVLLKSSEIQLSKNSPSKSVIDFYSELPLSNLEVRVICSANTRARVSSIDIDAKP